MGHPGISCTRENSSSKKWFNLTGAQHDSIAGAINDMGGFPLGLEIVAHISIWDNLLHVMLVSNNISCTTSIGSLMASIPGQNQW